jgi:hypothetical protein
MKNKAKENMGKLEISVDVYFFYLYLYLDLLSNFFLGVLKTAI